MPDHLLAHEGRLAAALAVMVVAVMDLLKVADLLVDRLKGEVAEDPLVDPLVRQQAAIMALVVEVLAARPAAAEDPQMVQEAAEATQPTQADQAVPRRGEPGSGRRTS